MAAFTAFVIGTAVGVGLWVLGAVSAFRSVSPEGINPVASITLGDLVRIQDLAIQGAETDGSHHKQWCLIQISNALGVFWPEGEIDEGIAP